MPTAPASGWNGTATTLLTRSDADLLTELAQDVALDFAETEVVSFGVAYLCNRVVKLRPINPNATMKPQTTRRQGVIIELHNRDTAPVGVFREILRSSGGQSMLGAPETLDGSFTDSPYSGVLKLVAEWKAADAKKVEAKAQVAARAKVAPRELSPGRRGSY